MRPGNGLGQPSTSRRMQEAEWIIFGLFETFGVPEGFGGLVIKKLVEQRKLQRRYRSALKNVLN